jgi:hypothetical protein
MVSFLGLDGNEHGFTLESGEFLELEIAQPVFENNMEAVLFSCYGGQWWKQDEIYFEILCPNEILGSNYESTDGQSYIELVEGSCVEDGCLGADCSTYDSITTTTHDPLICDSCSFDYSDYGAECCDLEWVLNGLNCIELTNLYGWDCSGCICEGDP